MFWEQFFGALFGTFSGGAIAAFIGYKMTQNANITTSTYAAVERILSPDTNNKRRMMRDGLKEFELGELVAAKERHMPGYSYRAAIIDLLNGYDLLLHSVEKGFLKGDIIRSTVWGFIEADHILAEEFLKKYSETTKQDRPLFPSIRRKLNKW